MEGRTVTDRTTVADLPDVDAARYLDREEAVAAYLTDILGANDGPLLVSALGDIARCARNERYRQFCWYQSGGILQGTNQWLSAKFSQKLL